MAISVSFPFFWAAQPGAWGPASLGAGFLYRILSPTHLIPQLIDFLSSPSYIIVQCPPSSCGRHNFTLIQPVHGQGYNSDIPWLDAPVIYTGAFPILTAQPGCRLIYHTSNQSLLNNIVLHWFQIAQWSGLLKLCVTTPASNHANYYILVISSCLI